MVVRAALALAAGLLQWAALPRASLGAALARQLPVWAALAVVLLPLLTALAWLLPLGAGLQPLGAGLLPLGAWLRAPLSRSTPLPCGTLLHSPFPSSLCPFWACALSFWLPLSSRLQRACVTYVMVCVACLPPPPLQSFLRLPRLQRQGLRARAL